MNVTSIIRLLPDSQEQAELFAQKLVEEMKAHRWKKIAEIGAVPIAAAGVLRHCFAVPGSILFELSLRLPPAWSGHL